MINFYSLMLIAHVVISVAIIGLVLLQRGKGADAGAAFGAGASGTVFGAKGSANFLSRTTAALATLFFVSSLSLAYLGSQVPESQSLMDGLEAPAEEISNVFPTGNESSAGADELPALPQGGADLPVPEAEIQQVEIIEESEQ